MKISEDSLKLFKIACEGDSNLLITGQTGTGKSTLAMEIHNNSARRKGPFITVNLACITKGFWSRSSLGMKKAHLPAQIEKGKVGLNWLKAGLFS